MISITNPLHALKPYTYFLSLRYYFTWQSLGWIGLSPYLLRWGHGPSLFYRFHRHPWWCSGWIRLWWMCVFCLGLMWKFFSTLALLAWPHFWKCRFLPKTLIPHNFHLLIRFSMLKLFEVKNQRNHSEKRKKSNFMQVSIFINKTAKRRRSGLLAKPCL